jgi:hypothetical protein
MTRRHTVPGRLSVSIACVALAALVAMAAGARADTIHLLQYPFDPALEEAQVPPELRATERAGATQYYLVQLEGSPTEERKAAVERAGGELIAYIPDNTYIVRMTPETRQALSQAAAVRWVGPFHPAYRISPSIGRHEFKDLERAADPRLTLMVRVFDNLTSTAQQIRALGAEVLEMTDDGFQKMLVVRADPDVVPAMAGVNDVWWIEEKPEFYLLNDQTKWVVQSNVTSSTPIWDMGIHGEGQLAAVMDSGLDYNSCWFREVGGAAPGPTHRKVVSYVAYGGNPYDGCDIGHGTHVCGTLAGDQSYINAGNTNYNGMASAAKLVFQDVGADDWSACNVGTVNIPTSLATAFTDAYNLGARVHSNSWGGSENTYNSYCVDIDSFMWGHKDFLVVFAAGNSGPNASTVTYPGTAKNCVTVGATQRSPSQDVIASYSSRGPASDTRYKPTVTAPGGEDPSFINSADNDIGNPPAQTCAVASSPFQGTSMATPAVAGCALLVRQYYTEGWYPSGAKVGDDAITPSAALLKATLANSAADMGTADIPNNTEGWGRVLLNDALYFEGDARELKVEDVTPGLTQGGTQTFELEVDSSSVPLEVTLVWTDYPATAGAGVAIQNNLDLTVTAPGGTAYKGNVFSGGQSTTGGSYDARNVEEAVRLATPAVGTYTVQVGGTTVPQGPQPFALVMTGSFDEWPVQSGVDDAPVPDREAPFRLDSITPNPFNPTTTINYELFPVATGQARLTLKMYSVDGRVVATLVDRVEDPGRYSVVWQGRANDGSPVASGIYFCELSYGGAQETRKVTLLK